MPTLEMITRYNAVSEDPNYVMIVLQLKMSFWRAIVDKDKVASYVPAFVMMLFCTCLKFAWTQRLHAIQKPC